MIRERATKPAATVDAPKQAWLLLVGVALVGIYAAMFVLVYTGHGIGTLAVYGSALWHGLFFHLWWRKIGLNPWHGAALGFYIGILAFCIVDFVAKFMSHG